MSNYGPPRTYGSSSYGRRLSSRPHGIEALSRLDDDPPDHLPAPIRASLAGTRPRSRSPAGGWGRRASPLSYPGDITPYSAGLPSGPPRLGYHRDVAQPLSSSPLMRDSPMGLSTPGYPPRGTLPPLPAMERLSLSGSPISPSRLPSLPPLPQLPRLPSRQSLFLPPGASPLPRSSLEQLQLRSGSPSTLCDLSPLPPLPGRQSSPLPSGVAPLLHSSLDHVASSHSGSPTAVTGFPPPLTPPHNHGYPSSPQAMTVLPFRSSPMPQSYPFSSPTDSSRLPPTFPVPIHRDYELPPGAAPLQRSSLDATQLMPDPHRDYYAQRQNEYEIDRLLRQEEARRNVLRKRTPPLRHATPPGGWPPVGYGYASTVSDGYGYGGPPPGGFWPDPSAGLSHGQGYSRNSLRYEGLDNPYR